MLTGDTVVLPPPLIRRSPSDDRVTREDYVSPATDVKAGGEQGLMHCEPASVMSPGTSFMNGDQEQTFSSSPFRHLLGSRSSSSTVDGESEETRTNSAPTDQVEGEHVDRTNPQERDEADDSLKMPSAIPVPPMSPDRSRHMSPEGREAIGRSTKRRENNGHVHGVAYSANETYRGERSSNFFGPTMTFEEHNGRRGSVDSESRSFENGNGRSGEDVMLRKQVEILLARVKMLERRQSHTEAFRDCKSSQASPTMLMTPPAQPSKLGRATRGGRYVGGGNAEASTIGVSTTPFTGLDVLFRTPRLHDSEVHDPPTPSRGQVQWGPPFGPLSPRRSRLTWSAGDAEATVTARGGRLPSHAPTSPPLWRLDSDSLREEAEDEGTAKAQGDVSLLRNRAATVHVASHGYVACASPDRERLRGRGREGLFLATPDRSRSRERCKSPGIRLSSRSRSPLLHRQSKGGTSKQYFGEDGDQSGKGLRRTFCGTPSSATPSPGRGRRNLSGEHRLQDGSVSDATGAAGRASIAGSGSPNVARGTPDAELKGLREVGPHSVDRDVGGRKTNAGPISLLEYMQVEIFGAEDHGVVDSQANRTVRNFLTVPRQLERLLLFGMLVCLDTFLYVITYLPIRIVIGLMSALRTLVTRRRKPGMNRPLLYDWMRGATIAAALCSLQFLEMSRVYHYIRGQAMVKLYVLIAMVEIFDKLMCSFGQDALDSLYLSTVHRKKRRVLLHFLVVCVTACLHSLLLFVHVTTLTVAVNSSDQALLTLLISNNFAEIKSSVFKKFDKHNLFQLSCHDVVERFKLALFLAMIMLLNLCQGGLEDPMSQFMSIFAMVFGGEVLADWIKHGFIIKFNQLAPSIYDEYSTILARDVAAFRKDDGSTLDHTHFVARRLAFATVPLNCVMIRFIQMAIPKLLQNLPEAPTTALCVTAVLFYLIALALKVLTGIVLMAQSCSLHPEAVISNSIAASWLRSPVMGAHKSRKELSLEKLSTIERFTLWKGRIV